MRDQWHIAVLIPAKDEEELIERCLISVISACDSLPINVSTDIIVVDDGSCDATGCMASKILGIRGTVLQRPHRCVGRSRHDGALEAIRRSPQPLDRCWLANTDADSIVPSSWLSHQLKHANAGYEGTAGIVDVDSFAEHKAHVKRRFSETYVLHKDGTHPHIHGANIGLRADVYLKVGGWAALSTGEDHDLWGKLKEANCRLKSDSLLKVTTSGRRIGRAPLGFAATLSAHNEAVV